MGALDLVGIATNYYKADLGLSSSQAGFIPGLVSVWFLLISIPAGRLMHTLGKRFTVLCALMILCPSLVAAIFCKSYWSMLAAMAMMGIGSTILVVSLNPLVASLVSGKELAASLTAGQCFKATAALTAPLIASLGIIISGSPIAWRAVFVVFFVVTLAAALLLSSSGRTEAATDTGTSPTSLRECLSLLKKPAILAAFIAVLCHVGSDVGITIAVPQLFAGRLALPLQDATMSVTVYFICRLAGALAGVYLLRIMSGRNALLSGVALLIAGIALACFAHSAWSLYLAVALMGLGNANICALIISEALLALPEAQNTTSAVITMGLAGGALFPLLMGFASDLFGLAGPLVIITACVVFVGIYALRLSSQTGKVSQKP